MDRSHQSSLELRILDLYIPKLKTARSCFALIRKYHLLQLCPSWCKQWLLGLSPFPFPRTKKEKYKLRSIALYTQIICFLSFTHFRISHSYKSIKQCLWSLLSYAQCLLSVRIFFLEWHNCYNRRQFIQSSPRTQDVHTCFWAFDRFKHPTFHMSSKCSNPLHYQVENVWKTWSTNAHADSWL